MSEPGGVEGLGGSLRQAIHSASHKAKIAAEVVTGAGVAALAIAWWTGGGAVAGGVMTGVGGLGWALFSGLESISEGGGTAGRALDAAEARYDQIDRINPNLREFQ